ncbi:MAG: MarR family transcriptional regulator [Rhodoferax sp.]|nr:MarR family transcriptional regulator [Rhodoferax sp.]
MSKARTHPPRAFYSAKDYRPEASVGYLMRKILSMVALDIERQLAHTELTNAQWVPLYKIYSGQASTVAEVARECHLDAGATTRMLDRLEAKGLCKRVRSQTDRRVVHIALTPAGTAAAADIPAILSGVQNAHLAGFSEQEFNTLCEYLRRILNNAQAIAKQAPSLQPFCP